MNKINFSNNITISASIFKNDLCNFKIKKRSNIQIIINICRLVDKRRFYFRVDDNQKLL